VEIVENLDNDFVDETDRCLTVSKTVRDKTVTEVEDFHLHEGRQMTEIETDGCLPLQVHSSNTHASIPATLHPTDLSIQYLSLLFNSFVLPFQLYSTRHYSAQYLCQSLSPVELRVEGKRAPAAQHCFDFQVNMEPCVQTGFPRSAMLHCSRQVIQHNGTSVLCLSPDPGPWQGLRPGRS